MLKNPFQVAITFALVAVVYKLILFSLDAQFGLGGDSVKYLYMFLVLLAVFFGIRSNKLATEGTTTFGDDFRAGARSASFFAIIVAGITYFYYAKIDVNYFPTLLDMQGDILQERINSGLANGEKLADLKDIARNQFGTAIAMYTPKVQALWTMFLLVFLGLFYSMFFPLLMRKLLKIKK